MFDLNYDHYHGTSQFISILGIYLLMCLLSLPHESLQRKRFLLLWLWVSLENATLHDIPYTGGQTKLQLLTILIINTIQWCLPNRVRATVLSFPNYWAKDYGRWPNNDLPSEIYQFTEGDKPSLEWRHMRVVLSQMKRQVGGLFSVWLARK